jgi:hypothetical protein
MSFLALIGECGTTGRPVLTDLSALRQLEGVLRRLKSTRSDELVSTNWATPTAVCN